MKVLIIGANHSQAIENHFVSHLEKLAEIRFMNLHGEFLDFYHKRFINKILFRIGLSNIIAKLNSRLINEVLDFKPDVLFVFKGMEILPSTLNKIKSMGVILTNYNPDHPTQHYSRGSGNKNVLRTIPYYDHHFCYSKNIQLELEKRFNANTSWLPFAYVYSKKNESSEVIKRICFIGNPDKIRSDLLNDLLKNNVPIQLFGYKWDDFIDSTYIEQGLCQILESTFNVEEAQKYGVQLNIFRPHNEGSHNLRTFEMPAIGTIMLAPYSEEHINLFEEGKEAFFYKSFEELLKKCKYLLSLDDKALKVIQNNAYQRSIQSGYGYEGRTRHIFDTFKTLMTNC